MLFLMYFKHELVVVKLSLGHSTAKTFKELIHNESLSAARVAPKVY
jgi:hypothetical protein